MHDFGKIKESNLDAILHLSLSLCCYEPKGVFIHEIGQDAFDEGEKWGLSKQWVSDNDNPDGTSSD